MHHVITEIIIINSIGHILRRTALYNMLLKQRLKGGEDKEKDLRSYWTTLRKTEDTGKLGRVCSQTQLCKLRCFND